MTYRAQSALDQHVWGWLARAWITHLDQSAPTKNDNWSRGRRVATTATLSGLQIARGHIAARIIIDGRTFTTTATCQWWPATAWKPLIEQLKAEPERCTELTRHEISPAFNQLFQQTGLTLFPRPFSCTCVCSPTGRTCVHTITMLYLFAQELDRDPPLILRLNGMTLRELLRRLAITLPAKPSNAMTLTHMSFWFGSELPADALPILRAPPAQPGIILEQGYLPPTDQGEPPLAVEFIPLYQQAATYGHQQRWPTAATSEEPT